MNHIHINFRTQMTWHQSNMYECHLGMDESGMIIMDESHSSMPTYICNTYMRNIHDLYMLFFTTYDIWLSENTSSMWMFAQNSNHTFEKSQQTSEKNNRHRIHWINKKIHQTKRTVCLGSTLSRLNLRKLDKCFSLLHKN